MAASYATKSRGTRRRLAGLVGSAVAWALLAPGCANLGTYVWVEDQQRTDLPPGGYVIGVGDVLSVRVFNQEAHSGKAKVRSDGKITLPLLNDVVAAGLTPEAFSEQLQVKLKQFINAPSVVVVVEESRPVVVSVLGEVSKTGQFQLEPGGGVLQALAAAGGLNDFAHKDRIFVLRQEQQLHRIRFSFEALSRGATSAVSFRLRSGDVLVVE